MLGVLPPSSLPVPRLTACPSSLPAEIACEPPQAPAHGSLMASGYSYGAQVTFRCDVGFTLRGADTATCLNSGEWDALPPTCTGRWDAHIPRPHTHIQHAYLTHARTSFKCEQMHC